MIIIYFNFCHKSSFDCKYNILSYKNKAIQYKSCYLISQSSQRHVRSLRHVEELAFGRLGEGASKYGPQLAELTEHGRLAAAIGTAHQNVYTRSEKKNQLPIVRNYN